MSAPPRESRPADNGAALENQPGGLASMIPLDPRDEVARLLNGAFILFVRTSTGRSRRRAFLTIASAEKAIARGETAVVILAELKPLFRVMPEVTS